MKQYQSRKMIVKNLMTTIQFGEDQIENHIIEKSS